MCTINAEDKRNRFFFIKFCSFTAEQLFKIHIQTVTNDINNWGAVKRLSNLVDFNEAAHQIWQGASQIHVFGAQSEDSVIETPRSHHGTRMWQEHVLWNSLVSPSTSPASAFRDVHWISWFNSPDFEGMKYMYKGIEWVEAVKYVWEYTTVAGIMYRGGNSWHILVHIQSVGFAQYAGFVLNRHVARKERTLVLGFEPVDTIIILTENPRIRIVNLSLPG